MGRAGEVGITAAIWPLPVLSLGWDRCDRNCRCSNKADLSSDNLTRGGR